MANFVRWLLPKEQKFFDMLKDQSSNVVEGANEFKKLIDNFDNLSGIEKRDFVRRIKDIEHKGDDLTYNITSILDKTFVTPIDKEDIYELTMLLDDVIDLIYQTSVRIFIYKINKIDIYIEKLTQIVIEIVEKIDQGILEVRNLKNMKQLCVEVHTLENKADNVYIAALSKLFEGKIVIDVIKYKEIYELLENITDKCEDVSNVIESIVVKHA
tara:strand:+ start:9806 stop:10444 length:639 start_codon:yes stop_codon:yes gene_type:complete